MLRKATIDRLLLLMQAPLKLSDLLIDLEQARIDSS